MISSNSIQQVIETARIEDVVRDYVDLRTRGSNMIGLCPFHKEKTPSFTISPSKNIYKCFGCDKGGDSLHFVMEDEQMSIPEAIRVLAKRYNIELEEIKKESQDPAQDLLLESLNIINQWAKEYYKEQLWNTEFGRNVGLSYFKQRGFLEKTLKTFEIGFAPDVQDAFTKESLHKSFSLELLQQLGLTLNSQKDFFRNRVIFPIHNQSGKVIGFAGRVFSSDVKIAKYINSAESLVYHKSKTLFGLHIAKNSIRKNDEVYLVEGYTDVMSLHQAGIENVVASSGTSLTEDQSHLLKRFTSNVVILYDGDEAGIKASMRGIDILIKEGLNVNIALLPDGNDPDSFIKKSGIEEFEHFIKSAKKDFILFKLQLLNNDAKDNPVLKSNVVKDIVSSISKIDDPIKRSIYLQQSAAVLKIPEANLIESCNQMIREDLRNKAAVRNREAAFLDAKILDNLPLNELTTSHLQGDYKTKDENQEKEIVRLLMLHGSQKWKDEDFSVAQYILENILDSLEYFEHSFYKEIILEIIHERSDEKELPLMYFINHANKQIKELAISFSAQKYEYSSKWEERHGIYLQNNNGSGVISFDEIEQMVKHLKFRKFDKVIEGIDQQILGIEDIEELATLLRVREELKNTRTALYFQVWNSLK